MILRKEGTLNAGPNIGTGEGVAHSKRWYVALVRMHHEKKVAERLAKMGIENFVPVQQEVHQWSDRRKVVESVLLPMMVFVHADPKERKEVYAKKDKLIATMNQKILAFYEKIRKWAHNTAVVPVKKQACYGCFMQINDKTFSAVIKGEDIVTCPHCGRILYKQEQ